MAQINWEEGQKFKCITPTTWALKVFVFCLFARATREISHLTQSQSPESRVAAAKQDLIRSNYTPDAGMLTAGRLNTAWQKLDSAERAAYLAARSKDTGKKRPKPSRDESKKERVATAQTNIDIARSLGLNGGEGGDLDASNPLEDDDLFGSRGFSVEAVAEGSTDERVYSHPMTGAVLHESGTFDSSSSILIVRVSSAGLTSQVGEPHKVDKMSLEIPVSRQNQPNFVLQLAPTAGEEAIAKRRGQLDDTLKRLYGDHMDFDVLDRASRLWCRTQKHGRSSSRLPHRV